MTKYILVYIEERDVTDYSRTVVGTMFEVERFSTIEECVNKVRDTPGLNKGNTIILPYYDITD